MKSEIIRIGIFFVLALAVTITVYFFSFKEGVTIAHVIGILIVSAAITGSGYALYRAIFGYPGRT